ncbi:MAG TPA: response regulator transcription factor [Chloroflexota bacterium]|nr:response regulator transcription factor [Chloroflexota bacterium]
MGAKILVVDDDADLLDVVSYVLRRHQFTVVTATDGLQALEVFDREAPDLVILDVNLPGLNGFEVCRRIRERAATPIIMLTVRSEDADVVGALRLGADDYVVKPFSTSQLVARVQAVLRRATGQVTAGPSGVPQVGALRLDLATHSAIWHGQAIPLTVEEYKILDCLLRRAGQPVPSAELIEFVWGPRGGSEELLKIHVRRLREKLEADPDCPRLVRTEAGGFLLDPAAAGAEAAAGG